jgi:hypothetical protein
MFAAIIIEFLTLSNEQRMFLDVSTRAVGSTTVVRFCHVENVKVDTYAWSMFHVTVSIRNVWYVVYKVVSNTRCRVSIW